MFVQNLEFETCAFEDLLWWVEKDKKKAVKIFKLIKEVCRTPYEGAGQPEELKHELTGCWSQRIDQEPGWFIRFLMKKAMIPEFGSSLAVIVTKGF